MKRNTFKEWYLNNKDSDILWEQYCEYKYEVKEMGINDKIDTFKQWMKKQYNWLIENMEL